MQIAIAMKIEMEIWWLSVRASSPKTSSSFSSFPSLSSHLLLGCFIYFLLLLCVSVLVPQPLLGGGGEGVHHRHAHAIRSLQTEGHPLWWPGRHPLWWPWQYPSNLPGRHPLCWPLKDPCGDQESIPYGDYMWFILLVILGKYEVLLWILLLLVGGIRGGLQAWFLQRPFRIGRGIHVTGKKDV